MFQFSKIFYLDLSQLTEKFSSDFHFLPSSDYLRGEIREDYLKSFQKSLIQTDGKVQIFSPITLYQTDNLSYVLSGVYRLRSLFDLTKNNPDIEVRSIPFRYVYGIRNKQDLLRFQAIENSILPSDPKNLLKIVKATFDQNMHLGRQKAKEHISNIFNLEISQVNQLLALADHPDFVVQLVKNGVISAELANKIQKKNKRLSIAEMRSLYDKLLIQSVRLGKNQIDNEVFEHSTKKFSESGGESNFHECDIHEIEPPPDSTTNYLTYNDIENFMIQLSDLELSELVNPEILKKFNKKSLQLIADIPIDPIELAPLLANVLWNLLDISTNKTLEELKKEGKKLKKFQSLVSIMSQI